MAERKRKKRSANPEFHRLNIDLEPAIYQIIKKLANNNERSVSKQAKVMLVEFMKRSQIAR